MKTRRANATVTFRGQNLTPLSLTYNDNYDKTDSLTAELENRNEYFTTTLFPEIGEKLTAKIQTENWKTTNDSQQLNLGSFEIDNITLQTTVKLGGVAIPITKNSRAENKNRAWRKIDLSAIATDISNNAGLNLFYDTKINPFYDAADQNDKSDLQFLSELCKSDGLCMKITNSRLIVFNEAEYEQKPPIATIKPGESLILDHPRFSRNARGTYKSCEISYFDPTTDRLYTGRFQAPTEVSTGHNLHIREHFNSTVDDMSLDRKAQARLRECNKNEWTCNITMLGNFAYATGCNITLDGWGAFGGKYHIAACTHEVSNSGYTTKLKLHRCLEY